MHLFIRLSQEQERNVDCLVKSSVAWNLKAPCLIMSSNKNFNFNFRTISLGITEIFENVSN